MNPASVVGAAGAAAASDAALQRYGNYLLGNDQRGVDWANAAGQGLISAGGQLAGLGVGHVVPKLAEVSPWVLRGIMMGTDSGAKFGLHEMANNASANSADPVFNNPSYFWGP